jgi:high-affinity K+ transport system ATPase subunit B
VETVSRRWRGAGFGFQLQIALWPWLIVLIANFAEAVAEGRGKAHAKALRGRQTQTFGRRLKLDGTEAAGDVDVLLLDKTGTVTIGNRQATSFLPVAGVTKQ